MLSLLLVLPVIAAAAGPASAPKPLTPEEAIAKYSVAPKRSSNGAAVTVEFQVLATGAYTADNVTLDFRATRDEKQDQFIVVLSEKAQAQLKRVGIHDLDRHFRGKRVRVTGPVSSEWVTGLDATGTYYFLQVDDIRQFEQVD
jgi:hypothetical protein